MIDVGMPPIRGLRSWRVVPRCLRNGAYNVVRVSHVGAAAQGPSDHRRAFASPYPAPAASPTAKNLISGPWFETSA